MIFFKHFLIFLVFLDFIFSENSENISKTFNETNQQDKIDGINDYLIRLKEIERFIIINERKLAEISKFRMTFLDMKSPHLFTSHANFILLNFISIFMEFYVGFRYTKRKKFKCPIIFISKTRAEY